LSSEYPGYFIVLEGTDGSGISTQISRISRILSARNRKVTATKEPSTGPAGLLIRQVLSKRLQGVTPEALALLFAADRLDHLEQEVKPVLESGGIVICDRYLWSTLAYQGLDLEMSWLRQINSFAMQPDLTVLIKVHPSVSMERIIAGRLRTELFEKENLLGRIQENFLTLAAEAQKAGQDVILVDGEQSMDEVTAAIAAGIYDTFPQLRQD
jgi:dTMP kinase